MVGRLDDGYVCIQWGENGSIIRVSYSQWLYHGDVSFDVEHLEYPKVGHLSLHPVLIFSSSQSLVPEVGSDMFMFSSIKEGALRLPSVFRSSQLTNANDSV